MLRNYNALFLGGLSFALFIGVVFLRDHAQISPNSEPGLGRVVISAPILVALYGGDRFLAANLEVIRLSATSMDVHGVDDDYLIRAQKEVSQLNPCHEDNYYLANGLLTWGGAVGPGNKVLEAAIYCRFWDYAPPFFYGVNLSFFQHDNIEAARFLEVSALRSAENAASLRKIAIMLRAGQFADERLALSYLTQQRDSSGDPKLKDMLDKRVVRLQGLLKLRDAQRRYEEVSGPLQELSLLIESGFLLDIPEDPLRLGYEIKDGRIEFKRLRFAGMED